MDLKDLVGGKQKPEETPEQTTPKTYTETELKEELEKRLGDHNTEVDMMVEEKVANMLRDFSPDIPTPGAVMKTITPTASENPVIAEFNKMFKAKGVGKSTMVFKALKYKSLTLRVKATISKNGNVFELLATKSWDSPFKINQPTDRGWKPNVAPIFFMANGKGGHGQLVVPASNPCLQKYLLIHPKYGKYFVLENKGEEATNRRKALMEVKRLENQLDNAEELELRIMGVGIVSPSGAYNMTKDELYMKMHEALNNNPVRYEQLTSDPSNIYKFNYTKGHHKGLLNTTGNKVKYKNYEVHNNNSAMLPADSFMKWATANEDLYDDLVDAMK